MSISNDPSTPNSMINSGDYDTWLENMGLSFTTNCWEKPLFRTDTSNLFELYLSCFRSDERQYYNCHTCRDFLNRFGGLVTITPEGRTVPALWVEHDAPMGLAPHAVLIGKAVSKAKVTGVFVSSEETLGRPVTGPWTHLAVSIPKKQVYKSTLLTSEQREAELAQDFQLVSKNLNDWSVEVVNEALKLVQSETISQAAKLAGPIKWLSELHASIAAHRNQRKNLIWRAIATAPAGWAHFSTGMPGVLLNDIAAGKSFEDIRRSLGGKMHGLQYQRPQAAPSVNQIEAAEKTVEKLGIAKSLVQRYAKIEECETIWQPTALASDSGSTGEGDGKVFAHLTPKEKAKAAPLDLPVQTITWVKFRDTILPDAKTIEYLVPYGAGNYMAFVTAEHADAPPILQWDDEEQRNPVSWYCYHNGSMPERWGLPAYGYVKVTAITLAPSRWYGKPGHKHVQSIVLLLEGARDKSLNSGALFPENMKPELHGIRSVIEAYSKTARISGAEEATACGLFLWNQWDATIRVNGANRYKLDRWD